MSSGPSDPVNPYPVETAEILHANSFDQVNEVMSRFSAEAPAGSKGAILYTGRIDDKDSGPFVKAVSEKSGMATIGDTPFGKFLGTKQVTDATDATLKRLFEAGGSSPEYAAAQSAAYIYGDGTQTPGLTRNADSLWGSRSETFVETVRGPLTLVSTDAPDDRIFPDVELQTALANPDVPSVGGVSSDTLRGEIAATNGNYKSVLGELQAPFRQAVEGGVFRDAAGDLEFSREAAQVLNFQDSDSYEPKAVLDRRADLTPVPPQTLRSYIGSYTPTSLPLIDPLAPSTPNLTPAEIALERHLDPEDRAALSSGDGIGGIGGDGAGASESLGAELFHGADIANTVLSQAYDAYETFAKYGALEAKNDQYAATDELRTDAIKQSSGLAFGYGGGAAAEALVPEGGPVSAGVGFAVGSAIGEFGGKQLAQYLEDRSIKLNQGTDGKTYQYDNGQWKTTHLTFTQAGTTDVPAPAAQIPKLDMERTGKIAALEIGSPTTLDPNTVSAADPATGITRTWERTGAQTWSSRVDDCTSISASPELVAKLNVQSQQVQASGPTSADAVAKAYVTDYYVNKWDQLGPLPDVVTTQLHLPTEQTIKDPQTGITWKVDGNDVTMDTALGPNGGAPPSTPVAPSTAVAPSTMPLPSAPTVPTTPAPGQAASAVASPSSGTSGNATPVPAPGLAPPQARPPTCCATVSSLTCTNDPVCDRGV